MLTIFSTLAAHLHFSQKKYFILAAGGYQHELLGVLAADSSAVRVYQEGGQAATE
jgi:hypothetical protein